MKILLPLSLILISCTPTAMDLTTAEKRNTPEAYRAFLFHATGDDEKFAARQKLEHLVFGRLAVSRGIAPVITFLHEFPDGRHHKEARALLATRRGRRALAATTVWPLIRFLHYHPGDPLAKKVRGVLEQRWFEALSRQPAISGLRRYLDYFPSGLHYSAAMEMLATLELKKLGDNPSPEALSLLSIAYANTRAGARAKAALARMRHLEILIAGDFPQVAALLLDTPDLPKELVRSSLNRHLGRAILALDHTTMTRICALSSHIVCPAPVLAAAARWKKLSTAARKTLAEKVSRAAPYRPFPSLKTLTVAMNSSDLRTVWIALFSLAYIDSPKGFFMILSQAGDPDLAVSSMAEESLRRWFARKLPWTKYLVRYARARLKGNLSEPRFFLKAFHLAAALGETRQLLPRLRRPMKQDEYQLAWELLRMSHLPGHDPARLIHLINVEAKKITGRFPAKLDNSSYLYARTVSRRLYALLRIMERTQVAGARYASLLDHVKRTFANWDKALGAFSSYESSTSLPILEQVATWNTDRLVARSALATLKGAEGPFWGWYFKNMPSN